jgi:hypothetical protein
MFPLQGYHGKVHSGARRRSTSKVITMPNFVEFMKDIFELHILSDLSQGTTNSMVFGRNVENLSCLN